MSQIVLLVLSLTCMCQIASIRAGPTILESPNVTDFGRWGEFEYCSRRQLVTAFQLKVEPKHSVDDTGLNGIRFFCGQAPSSVETEWKNITSRVGPFGNWGHVFNCASFAVGFELQSQPYQGVDGDDTAADNLKIHCADGTVIEGFVDNGHTFANSTYTAKQECPKGQAFCGLQTQVERYQVFGDDTALNNIRVKCCDINPINDPAGEPDFPIIEPDSHK